MAINKPISRMPGRCQGRKVLHSLQSVFFLLCCCWHWHQLQADFWGFGNARESFLGQTWAYSLDNFDDGGYQMATEAALQDFEQLTGKTLTPGKHRRVAVKLYTNSGPGIATPTALTRAVIQALVARGYQAEDIMLLDWRSRNLRDCGYLPPLSQSSAGNRFEGAPVIALEQGELWDPVWFYESALPDLGRLTESNYRDGSIPNGSDSEADRQNGDSARSIDPSRQSFLPKPLLTEVDFWINLPVVTDHPRLGLNGSLANATLWNASNTSRFFSSDNAGQVAIAEMAAIPELLDNWALTLLSLQAYQYIGGPEFNSLYTLQEPLLLAGVDPVALDQEVLERINQARQADGFTPLPLPLPQLVYATRLGVGADKQAPSK